MARMPRNGDLKYLDDNIAGPILRIEDPRIYTQEQIIGSYYREIVLIAGKFTRPNIEKEDLVAEGIIGLLDAVERWDPGKSKGNPRSFHNLAIVRIKSFMYNFFLENSGRYKFPSYMARGLTYLNQARRIVEEAHFPGEAGAVLRNLDSPEFDEWATPALSTKLKKSKEKLNLLAKSINSDYASVVERILTVEQNIESYEKESAEEVYNPEELAANKEFVQSVLETLNPETRNIISMSLEGMTLEEIGEVQGKTRQRIQQIRQKFLEVLRNTRMYKSSFED